jgi:hypothetical protein
MITQENLIATIAERPRWRVLHGPADGQLATPFGWAQTPEVTLLLDMGRPVGLLWLRDNPVHGFTATYYKSIHTFIRETSEATNPYYGDGYRDTTDDYFPIKVDADPEDLGTALRDVEQIRDETLLAYPEIHQLHTELVAEFHECMTAPGMPWDGGGSLNAPHGGYVQWTRMDEPGSPIHLEVSDGGEYSQPLPHDLRLQLVYLGWQAPDEDFRNAWLRAQTDQELADAARLVVLALSAALGVELSHLNWARLNE